MTLATGSPNDQTMSDETAYSPDDSTRLTQVLSQDGEFFFKGQPTRCRLTSMAEIEGRQIRIGPQAQWRGQVGMLWLQAQTFAGDRTGQGVEVSGNMHEIVGQAFPAGETAWSECSHQNKPAFSASSMRVCCW